VRGLEVPEARQSVGDQRPEAELVFEWVVVSIAVGCRHASQVQDAGVKTERNEATRLRADMSFDRFQCHGRLEVAVGPNRASTWRWLFVGDAPCEQAVVGGELAGIRDNPIAFASKEHCE